MREVFDSFFDPIGGHIIGRRLGAQAQAIADVLFEGAVCVVSANDRIGKIQILDNGLKLALIELGDLATEDGVILLGWPMVRLASRSRWSKRSSAARR